MGVNMKLDIAWPRRCFQRRRHQEIWLLEAILLERKLVGDRPSMQVVCRLGVIDESRTNDTGAQGQILGLPIPCPKVR
jgi:hypothetical protein